MNELFQYGQTEIDALSAADPILGAAIAKIGLIHRAVIPDLFAALVYAIVGQQISTKAQQTIWARMQQTIPLTPKEIAALPPETLQS